VSGTDQLIHRRWSARQRIVVLTFDTIEGAEAWDREGQPLGDDLVEYAVEVAVVADEPQ